MRSIGIRIALVFTCLAFAPSFVFAQDAATVTCKDGSTGKAGKGACSHHGGVNKGAPAAPASPGTSSPAAHKAPANDNATPPAATQRSSPPPSSSSSPSSRSAPASKAAPGQPTAKCKDGSMSYSAHHSGACSHHGGVNQWLDGTQ